MSNSFSSILNTNYNKCKTKYVLPPKSSNTSTSTSTSGNNINDAIVPNVYSILPFPYGSFLSTLPVLNQTTTLYCYLSLIDKLPLNSTLDVNSITLTVGPYTNIVNGKFQVGIYETTISELGTIPPTGNNCILRGELVLPNTNATVSRVERMLIPTTPSQTTLQISPNKYYYIGISFIFDSGTLNYPVPLNTMVGDYSTLTYINDQPGANHDITLNGSMLPNIQTQQSITGFPYFSIQ